MLNHPFDYPLGIRPWPGQSLRLRPTRLREGYCFDLLEHSSDSYRFTAMAGANKIAGIVRDFARLLPEEAFFILEYYDGEQGPGTDAEPTEPSIFYSPYLPTAEILATLEPFLPRLVHDGFVGFGLANNRAGMEFFYSEEKVITCFSDNHLRLTDLFARHRLTHRAQLLLPGDFGHDHLSLLCHPRQTLPEPFASLSDNDLDSTCFCHDLVELLELYQVEESLSFFLSRREQEQIAQRLAERPDFEEFVADDFGSLLLDWNDFVGECSQRFEGDLWEYRQGLKLRDVIQFVIEGVPGALADKLQEIVAEPDAQFRQLLVDSRKRLDPPSDVLLGSERFWCRGVVSKQGVVLRRDLIRQGWFQC